MQELVKVAPVLGGKEPFSPSCLSSAATCPGVGLEPKSKICAGSPGIACRIENTSSVMPNSTGTVTRSRRRMS